MAKTEKIQLVHPAGKNAPRISTETYLLISDAIIKVLQQQQPLSFADMAREVRQYVSANSPGFEGSVEWFTVSIKQHMEAEGIIETVTEKGRKMHRLT
ncbi:MAG TPA: hypothetical protein VIN07_05765 [Flavipsychrobacter sp.]